MNWPVYVIDHAQRAVEALPWPVSTYPHAVAFVRATGRQVQQLEDVQRALLTERQLPEAVGAQLEAWGELLDEPQGDLTIAEWRLLLRAKLRLPHSACRTDEIAATLRAITGDHGPTYVYKLPPARLGLHYFADVPLSAAHRERVKLWMERMVTGGVAIEHIIETPLGGLGLSGDEDPLLEGLGTGLMGEVI